MAQSHVNDVAMIANIGKDHKEKMLFVTINTDEENNKRIFEFFGILNTELPTFRAIKLGKVMAKFKLNNDTVEAENIMTFVTKFLSRELKQHPMSKEFPKDWDKEAIKVLDGKNFHEVAWTPTGTSWSSSTPLPATASPVQWEPSWSCATTGTYLELCSLGCLDLHHLAMLLAIATLLLSLESQAIKFHLMLGLILQLLALNHPALVRERLGAHLPDGPSLGGPAIITLKPGINAWPLGSCRGPACPPTLKACAPSSGG